jgi:hypothetical protein
MTLVIITHRNPVTIPKKISREVTSTTIHPATMTTSLKIRIAALVPKMMILVPVIMMILVPVIMMIQGPVVQGEEVVEDVSEDEVSLEDRGVVQEHAETGMQLTRQCRTRPVMVQCGKKLTQV